jgi:hypothetical protein
MKMFYVFIIFLVALNAHVVDASLEVSSLIEAVKEIKEVLSLVYNRYELNGRIGSNFFLTSSNLGPTTWDVVKYKVALKTLTGNKRFLMIFGGSSVTAGHDNYYNQSYPAIVRKRLHSIFQKLGIELQVHNIAEGANNCAPYILCYEAMGGLNPDFIGWEQVIQFISNVAVNCMACFEKQ